MKIVVDAKNAIVGRLGSYVAKELLKGKEVDVINSEEAIISGRKKVIVDKVIRLRAKGGTSRKGPKVSIYPERLLKRMIRGMLPYDKARGREAYKRLKCYTGDRDEKTIKKFEHQKPLKYMKIKDIVKLIK